MKLQRDLREFVESLSSSGVEFLVVGGHAVAFHGHPRYIGDIDFLVRPTKENAERVLDAISRFGLPQLTLSAEDFTRPVSVVQLGRPPNRIDLLTEISGVDFATAWAGRETADLDGCSVFILGRKELLLNKRASGRPKDLADIDALEKVANAKG